LPERVQLSAAPAAEPPPQPRRSAEERVAEAAGKLGPESVRTEQASAAAIFAEPRRRVADEPSVIVEPSVHLDLTPSPSGYTDPDAKPLPPFHARGSTEPDPLPLSPSEIHTETMPAPELPPLDADLANDIRRALTADDPAIPRVPTPIRPQDAWAVLDQIAPRDRGAAAPVPASAPADDSWATQTAESAGPDMWATAAPPKEGAWQAGPAAAAGPDWSAVSADSNVDADWAPPPPLPSPAPSPTGGAVPLPGSFVFSEDTTVESDRERGFTPLPGEEDLPVPVVAPVPGLPEFLFGEPRVVVHTLAGRVKRGTLRTTDLGQAELRLLHPAGGGEERIDISEVKAVFFMLEPGAHLPAAPGSRVRVTLSDGRMLEGFRESDGPSGGLFIVPLDATRTNTRAIFVCGDAIQNVDQA
jgi:hypothetical protein